MKTCQRIVWACLLFLTLGTVRAQTDSPVGVAVTLRALNLTFGGSGSTGLDLGISGLNGYQTASAPSRVVESPQLTTRLEPGKSYFVSITSFNISNFTLQAVPPAGYVMEIERVARERYTPGVGGAMSIQVRVLSPATEYAGRAGTATSLMSGRVYWQAALGSLANGSSAGAISIIDTGTSSGWTSLFSPASLNYEHTSSEVTVIYNGAGAVAPYIPGTIRQIIAPEACVDVVVTSAAQAELKFYHRGQKVAGSGLYTFTGSPFAWYLINRTGSQPNQVYIDCDVRQLPNLTDPLAPVVQSKRTVLSRSGTAPNYTWTADEWYTGSTALSRDVRARSSGIETVTVLKPGESAVTSRTKTYTGVPWGEEVTAETAGTTNPISADTVYYTTTSAQGGNYGRMRSTITNGGTWEAYEYYDYSAGTADTAGAVYRVHRPYLDSATTVPTDLTTHSSGVVTTYTYVADAFGRKTRPAGVTTTIGGTLTSSSTTTYSEVGTALAGHPLLYLVTATNAASTSSSPGSTLTSISRYFREDAGANVTTPSDDFFRGQIHSIEQSDGRKQSYVYQRGTWNGTTFTLSANSGADSGPASRISVITGSGTAPGTLTSSYGGYDIEDIYLVDGKSTMQVTIRDDSALVRRTETYAWSAASWQLVGYTNFDYNYSNLLTDRVDFNGGQYQASWNGERLLWEKDEQGLRVDYTYDEAGRVLTATKSGGPTTTFTYDAEHRALSETMSAPSYAETLYSARTYDDAGRIKTELPIGMGTITHSYNPVARTRTATFPDTSARTEYYYADGQLEHVDGSAVVPQYNRYTIEGDGRRTVKVSASSATSPRWQKATTDWLGRTLSTERPGFSVTGQAANTEDYTYEAVTGRLDKVTRVGYAPTKYVYDNLANVVRSGLDLLNNGLVDNSSDRIAEQNQVFEQFAGSWWLKQETKTYPFANATAVVTGSSRKRLTGFAAGRLDETQVTDAEGNTVTRIVDVDRTNAITTITTTRPGVAYTQIETLTNGLSTSVRGHDGLTSTAQYDPLSRAWKNIDTRGNTATTTYKYGSTLVQSVSDGAGNVLGTVSYDNMGRKQWAQDANGQYTHYAYNLRGQLEYQWGGGSYPVSFAYDPNYGDQTGLSTYRSAPAAESATWPAVGAADTTTWTYDTATGLLWKKTDAASPIAQVTEFAYNVRGQTSSRAWSRKLTTPGKTTLPFTTTYSYDSDTGELLSKTYNDTDEAVPTPSVTYTYTRSGQVKTVVEGAGGAGSRTFGYNAAAPWRLDNETLDATFYASRIITRQYDSLSGTGGTYGPYTKGTVKGRYVGYDLGVSGNTSRDQHIAYTASNLGRFVGVNTRTISSEAGAAFDYVYTYATNSSLIAGYSRGNFSVARTYETQRNVLTSISGSWSTTTRTRYDYTINAAGQRITAKQSGSAYADYNVTGAYSATYNVYRYNARGELETTKRYRGDTPSATPSAADELPGGRFEYRFDSIGNRVTSGTTGTASDDQYQTNSLNQYEWRKNKTVRASGTANADTVVAVTGAGTASKKDRTWFAEITPANAAGPVKANAAVYAAKLGGGSGGADLVKVDNSRTYFVPALHQVMAYDADGNLKSDGVWNYTYNAENQLVRMASVLPAGFTGMRLQLDFKYDYQGRRVEKRVYDNDVPGETSLRRYLYDGFNLIAETDAAGALKRTFTWGLDLAGTLTATGGVGALLQINDLAESAAYSVTYDGNGNIASLLDPVGGTQVAAYEYDPSGNLLRCEGPYAKKNPFRFSTKWQDDESGLINYGFRYYSPTMGRFINRDPIAEKGGLNLYGFCGNDGINSSDFMGFEPMATVVLPKFVATGAKVGSAFGPIGAVVGGIVGGFVGLFSSNGLFGKLFGGGGGSKPPVKPKPAVEQGTPSSYRPNYTYNGGQRGYWMDGKWYDMSNMGGMSGGLYVEPGLLQLDPIVVTAQNGSKVLSALAATLKAMHPVIGVAQNFISQYQANLGVTGRHYDAIMMTANPAYTAISGASEAFSGIGMDAHDLGRTLTGWGRVRAVGKVAIGVLGTFALASSFVPAGAIAAENTALRFTQKTASPWFDVEGKFAHQTISDVAGKLRAGTLTAADVPVEIVGNGLIVNTRSSLALAQAGIPQSEWLLLRGSAATEARIAQRLLDNGLTNAGTDVLRITGSGGNASTLIGSGTIPPRF